MPSLIDNHHALALRTLGLLRRLSPLGLPALFLSGPLLGVILVDSIFGLPPILIWLAAAFFVFSFTPLIWLAYRRQKTDNHSRE